MSKKSKRRRYTVEEKLRILEEARQPNTTVAEKREALAGDFELEHIRIRTYPPESNGKLERARKRRERVNRVRLQEAA